MPSLNISSDLSNPPTLGYAPPDNVPPKSPPQNPLPAPKNVQVPELENPEQSLHQIEVELSRRHPLPFVRLTKPDYLADRVHLELCKIVEEFHRKVQRRESPRTIIICHPQSERVRWSAATIPTISEMTLEQSQAESRSRIPVLLRFHLDRSCIQRTYPAKMHPAAST
jgi:hypothetical protein